MIGLGSDCGFVLKSLHGMLTVAGRDHKLNTELTPAKQLAEPAPPAR
jgi:hypothetical protein